VRREQGKGNVGEKREKKRKRKENPGKKEN
jgi:hypothetical protein